MFQTVAFGVVHHAALIAKKKKPVNLATLGKIIIHTRMHFSRMRTAHSLTVSPYLIVSHACPPEQPCMPPQKQPCTPPQSNHACPLEQSRTPPEQPHTPLSNHACLPRATMHAPRSNHACPPGATMHAPQSNHAYPPKQPCMHTPPRATTHTPPGQNDRHV